MYAPAQHDEITGLVNYLDQQLTAVRSSAFGLTEAQAKQTPCRSALSIGGLIKHVTLVLRGSIERLSTGAEERRFDEAGWKTYADSFVVDDDSDVAATITDFDAARAELLDLLAASDPADPSTEPPAPWHGIFEPQPINARYHLVHLIEETARHAGHADIIREELDGMSVPALVMTLAGAPTNDFFQPYVAAPGTLLA